MLARVTYGLVGVALITLVAGFFQRSSNMLLYLSIVFSVGAIALVLFGAARRAREVAVEGPIAVDEEEPSFRDETPTGALVTLDDRLPDDEDDDEDELAFAEDDEEEEEEEEEDEEIEVLPTRRVPAASAARRAPAATQRRAPAAAQRRAPAETPQRRTAAARQAPVRQAPVRERAAAGRTAARTAAASRTTAAARTPARAASRSSSKVVIVPGRDRYHTQSCRFIQGKDDTEEITAASAKRKGYQPCSVCKPG